MKSQRQKWAWLTVLLAFALLFSPAPAMHASAQDLQYQTAMQNDKLIVTASLKNQGDGRNIGIIAVGYDANGKAIETKGSDVYIPRGQTGKYSIVMDRGAQIAKVQVTPADLANLTGKLSSTAYTLVNGKMVVTAVVENGGDGRNIGVIAVGYDANGKAIETKGTDTYIPRNEVGNYQILLDHGPSIASVNLYLADLANPAGKLRSQAHTLVNGKMVVTAVVENGGDGRNIGVYAIGYDAKGKPIETKGQDTYIPRNEVGNYQIILDQGAKIASAKVFPVDLSNPAVKLSSSAYTPVNGAMLVTAVVENGGDGKQIGITAVGYDAGGKPVASKSGKTYIPRNEVGNYQLSLPNAGKIASVKVTVNP